MRGKSRCMPVGGWLNRCFNEARALCAGSRCGSWWCSRRSASFNEARALCAGSPQKVPTADSRVYGFNEARALCAGSLRVWSLHMVLPFWLQ